MGPVKLPCQAGKKAENIGKERERRAQRAPIENMNNEMELIFDGVSCNEGLARVAVAAFVSHLNPTLEELSDVKTAVSEAVTNAIIHGYGNYQGYSTRGAGQLSCSQVNPGKVRLWCSLKGGILEVLVEDQGKGIENIAKAMEPLYTTCPELDRSGMGFAFMEAFMDDLRVESTPGAGTRIHMTKKMTNDPWIPCEE